MFNTCTFPNFPHTVFATVHTHLVEAALTQQDPQQLIQLSCCATCDKQHVGLYCWPHVTVEPDRLTKIGLSGRNL